jgi:hypothetical protein
VFESASWFGLATAAGGYRLGFIDVDNIGINPRKSKKNALALKEVLNLRKS